jgi:hypothetical protein
VCGKVYANGSALKRHCANRHGVLYNRSKKYPCRLCGKEFTNSHLLVHMEEHKEKGDYVPFVPAETGDGEEGRVEAENGENVVLEETEVPCSGEEGQDIMIVIQV